MNYFIHFQYEAAIKPELKNVATPFEKITDNYIGPVDYSVAMSSGKPKLTGPEIEEKFIEACRDYVKSRPYADLYITEGFKIISISKL